MSSSILVLCDHENGTFKKTAAELLGKAVQLAGALGGTVSAVVIGHPGGAELGALGASKVYSVAGSGDYDTVAMVEALQTVIGLAAPKVLLASASVQARDSFPRLAARMGFGLGTEVTDLRVEGGAVVGRRPQYAGKALSDVHISSATALYTVRPNSFPVPAAGSGAAEVVAIAAPSTSSGLRVVDREAPTSTVVDLTEASRIVSGGRSVKSAEGFDGLIRPLAASIGATPGASRAAVDAGYAPHSAQVGQTGKTVNPSLYIACGISGAIQHLAGMRTSKVIVAINKDPTAPIFGVATYGIVGDMFEVGPLLTAEFKRALA